MPVFPLAFLSLSSLSAVPVVATAEEDAPEPVWRDAVSSDVMKFRCSDAENRVVFKVELFKLAEPDIKQGKAMKIPKRFWNTSFSRFPVTKRRHWRSLLLLTQRFVSIASKSGVVLRHRHCPLHEC